MSTPTAVCPNCNENDYEGSDYCDSHCRECCDCGYSEDVATTDEAVYEFLLSYREQELLKGKKLWKDRHDKLDARQRIITRKVFLFEGEKQLRWEMKQDDERELKVAQQEQQLILDQHYTNKFEEAKLQRILQ